MAKAGGHALKIEQIARRLYLFSVRVQIGAISCEYLLEEAKSVWV